MRAKRLLALGSVIGDVLLWSALVFVACIVTLAVSEHQAREAAALRRVHSDGMAVGSSLCGKESS